MRYFDAFAGIGGFSLGIQNAYGVRDQVAGDIDTARLLPNNSGKLLQERRQRPVCVGYSEIDKYASSVYEYNFKGVKNYGDITKINADELPDFDCLVGGFPCQSFSVAGKRQGFNDTRGTLFFDIARIAREKQPMYMLLENVKGLISHDKGKTLEVILETLQDLGYYVNYEVHNSKDFGVPQNRERIFFLCRHAKLLEELGQSKIPTTSKEIISEYLFQLLLNNLTEVKKLQETSSKEWVLGYLLLKEMNQSPKSSDGSTMAGTMPMADGMFQSKTEEVYQSIDTWLSKNLADGSNGLSMSTILTAIRRITTSTTYTYSSMRQLIWLATVALKKSQPNLWQEVLSDLILIKEDTKYARLNNKKEEVIITESGTAHFTTNFQDYGQRFIEQHLRGECGGKVFPISGDTGKALKQVIGGSQGNRVYATDGVSSTIASQAGGLGAKTGLYIAAQRGRGNPPKQTLEPQTEDKTNSITSVTKDNLVVDQPRIRRLTPTECERLQGFPETEVNAIIDVCIDHQKNSVSVEVVNLKSQRLAGIAGNNSYRRPAPSAPQATVTSDQPTRKPAQQNVHIFLEDNKIKLYNHEKSLSYVSGATSTNSLAPPIQEEDFVQMIAGTLRTAEKITTTGKVESALNDKPLTAQESGSSSGKIYGCEITLPAKNALSDLTTLRELLKSTTSPHLDTESLGSLLATLSYSVASATNGYTESETPTNSTYRLHLVERAGWTAMGVDGPISDSQRYKMCGNAVTTNVICDVFTRIFT